jgi:hypothetical protein
LFFHAHALAIQLESRANTIRCRAGSCSIGETGCSADLYIDFSWAKNVLRHNVCIFDGDTCIRIESNTQNFYYCSVRQQSAAGDYICYAGATCRGNG